MEKKEEWITIDYTTSKMRVEDGWIYKHGRYPFSVAICFVPNINTKQKPIDSRQAPVFEEVGGAQFYAVDGKENWFYVNHAKEWKPMVNPWEQSKIKQKEIERLKYWLNRIELTPLNGRELATKALNGEEKTKYLGV